MKLRKILAGFLAGAVAMSSMVFTAVAEDNVVDYSASGVYATVTANDTTNWGIGVNITVDPTAYVSSADLSSIAAVKVNVNKTAGYAKYKFGYNSGADGDANWVSEADYIEMEGEGDFSNTHTVNLVNASGFNYVQLGCDWINHGVTFTVSSIEFLSASGSVLATAKNSGEVEVVNYNVWEKDEDGVYTYRAIPRPADATDWNDPVTSTEGAAYLKGVSISDYLPAGFTAADVTSINATATISGGSAGVSFGCNTITADGSTWSQITLASGEKGTIETPYGLADDAAFQIGVDWLNYGTTITIEFEVTAEKKTYPITIQSATNGTVTADVTEAEEGATVTLTVDPEDGYELDTLTVTGASGAVTVTDNAFAMPAEAVTVTATFKAIEAESVTLDRTTAAILVGGTTTLVATVDPADALDQTITWTSSDTAIATVDQTGKVTGVAAGTATITAKCGDVSAACVVTVTEEEVAVESIELDATEITSYVGVTTPVTATVLPVDATYDSITWTSSDAAVATVANGKVTAVGEGTATITASIGDISASLTITVIPEGYDKTEASFTADTIVAQTSKSINSEGDIVTARRFVKMVSKASIEDKNLVTFTLSNGTATKTVEATSYYTELSASGETVTAPEGYVFLAYTVTDIPDGVTVTCTDITVSKK